MTPPFDELVAFANTLADAAGDVIRPWFRVRLDVVDKGSGRAGYDPVTEADREGEAAMRRLIAERYPLHGVIGEEHGEERGADPLTWVLDPIDGTRAFICGQTQWGILIALNDGARPILGVLDQPITRERWIGAGGETHLVTASGREKLRTRACESIATAVLTTTHPTGYFTPAEQAAFQELGDAARMTRFGGDCYAYGLLAMGFVDLIVEASLKPWDVQALVPIVEGAGGIITTWDGGDPQHGGRIVAAGDPRVHTEALAVLRGVA
ncbi:MAG: histidinol-phosphatase [Labilithrix sp.]|nr:histidinol-phosphatase [Labilithrix sp.]MCW5812270.1 histidinol-phosphatase [Labilithrix sp.]